MNAKHINLSTGPVGITMEVQKALSEPPTSHRSATFRNLYDETTALLCRAFAVRDSYLLTGSGTLANDVMLEEIKCLKGKGLILSNGEFGERLAMQATRQGLEFIRCRLDWGTAFDMEAVEQIMVDQSVQWILCCHCETSTGMVVDLKQLTQLASRNNCLCFIDCMSTVGTAPLDLSGVAMATASSGKGLASIPGLAIVMSNIEPALKSGCPVYLDLYHYKKTGSIPFTIPSNLVRALYISISQKLNEDQYNLVGRYRKIFFDLLNDLSLVPFSHQQTAVFTIVPAESKSSQVISHLKKCQLEISYESDYLKKRGWCQLATFGYYTEDQLREVADVLCLLRGVVDTHRDQILV